MPNKILFRALISEKSMKEAASNRFTFEVAKETTKPEIAAEVARTFKVQPISIKTITIKGKSRRAGKTRQLVAGQSYKKAIVELPKGQKIALFDVTEKEVKNAEKV